jgi:hypothetical protein
MKDPRGTTGEHATRKREPRCSQPPLGGLTTEMLLLLFAWSGLTIGKDYPVIKKGLSIKLVNDLLAKDPYLRSHIAVWIQQG